MTGYAQDFSMSNRALAAYEEGLVPASKLTARALRNAGVATTLKDVKLLINAGKIIAAEWHHTSKIYNETDFYSAEDIKQQLDAFDNLEETISQLRTKKTANTPVAVHIEYAEWEGATKSTRRLVEKESDALRVGNWYHLPNGRRKAATGTHIHSETPLKTMPTALKKLAK